MAKIRITHTRTEGTLVEGSTRGDGVYEILHGLHGHWRPFRSLGCLGLVQTRNQAAKTWIINPAAQALRAAGHTVEVAIDDTTAGRPTAEVEAGQAGRAADRVGRYDEYAGNAAARAGAAYGQYRQMADQWPTGQPLISDAARRSHARMMGHHDRAAREQDQADHWSGRAEASAAHQAHHESLPATLRRIDRLETRERDLHRRLDGTSAASGHGRPATGEDRDRLLADLAAVRDSLSYWRDQVEQAKARGAKVWGPGDFSKGDYVFTRGRLYQVERVNPKSLSVPHGNNDHELPVVIRDKVRHALGPSQWTRKIPYDTVRGHCTAAQVAEAMAEAEAEADGRAAEAGP